MRSRLMVLCAALLAFMTLSAPKTVAAQEDLMATLTSIEKALWEGWKNADASAFQDHLADGFVLVNSDGVFAGKAENVAAISSGTCDVQSFSFSNWNIHRVGEHTVIITYDATQDATCEGTKLPENVRASSVYVSHDGRWLAASYQETPTGM
jgi:hypothetical protein